MIDQRLIVDPRNSLVNRTGGILWKLISPVEYAFQFFGIRQPLLWRAPPKEQDVEVAKGKHLGDGARRGGSRPVRGVVESRRQCIQASHLAPGS